MKTLIFWAVINLSFASHAAVITAISCDGNRAMIFCRGDENNSLRVQKFWLKYPSVGYDWPVEAGSPWVCQASGNGKFSNEDQAKFNVDPAGNTLIISGGVITNTLSGSNKLCPLSFK